MTRRSLLFGGSVLPALTHAVRASERSVEILEALWRAVRDRFYDPQTRGVDWAAIRDDFLRKAKSCASDAELLSLGREMLARLPNSHVFLYSRDEWSRRRNILPFYFENVSGPVFVRYVLRGHDGGPLAPLLPGDELQTVDGIPANRLRPLTLARLDPIYGNPLFGPPQSVAKIELLRNGRTSIVQAARVARPSGFEPAVVEQLPDRIVHLRFFSLASADIPPERLRRIWDKAIAARGLILDVRNCVGGDSKVTNFIAGSLLGPGKPLFRSVPRPESGHSETIDLADPTAPRFTGRAAVITNSNTESQPEILSAICKEHGCAAIVGERTAGAFHGFTQSVDLPYNFALFALPYTRSVSPKGNDYEGRGVEPDERVLATASDLENGRDRPLAAAIKRITA